MCILPQIFGALAAKLCDGCEHAFDIKEWHGPPLSPCQVWRESDWALRRVGGKKMFLLSLSVTFLNATVCQRHFAVIEVRLLNAKLPSLVKGWGCVAPKVKIVAYKRPDKCEKVSV